MRQAIMTKPGAIRGSDVHVYHGTHPFVDYPVVPRVHRPGAGVTPAFSERPGIVPAPAPWYLDPGESGLRVCGLLSGR
jgi:hypothetical protein